MCGSWFGCFGSLDLDFYLVFRFFLNVLRGFSFKLLVNRSRTLEIVIARHLGNVGFAVFIRVFFDLFDNAVSVVFPVIDDTVAVLIRFYRKDLTHFVITFDEIGLYIELEIELAPSDDTADVVVDTVYVVVEIKVELFFYDCSRLLVEITPYVDLRIVVEVHHFDRDKKVVAPFFVRNFLENIDDIGLFVFVHIILLKLVDLAVELDLLAFGSKLVTLLRRFRSSRCSRRSGLIVFDRRL